MSVPRLGRLVLLKATPPPSFSFSLSCSNNILRSSRYLVNDTKAVNPSSSISSRYYSATSSTRMDPEKKTCNWTKAWFKMEWTGPELDPPTKNVSKQSGTVNFTLYNTVVPKTVENFAQFCNGTSNPAHKYKGSAFHRVIPGFMLQGGDFTRQNGTGGLSIYGEKFEDENFIKKHDKVGLLSMANAGPNTNGSQFFVTTAKTGWLDGKHVVFGEVADDASMKVVRAIEATGSSTGDIKYSSKPTIVDCGATQE